MFATKNVHYIVTNGTVRLKDNTYTRKQGRKFLFIHTHARTHARTRARTRAHLHAQVQRFCLSRLLKRKRERELSVNFLTKQKKKPFHRVTDYPIKPNPRDALENSITAAAAADAGDIGTVAA